MLTTNDQDARQRSKIDMLTTRLVGTLCIRCSWNMRKTGEIAMQTKRMMGMLSAWSSWGQNPWREAPEVGEPVADPDINL